jgi:L-ribulokinase
MTYTLGLDYGTNSVRALIVNCADGRELATSVFPYPSGDQGVMGDAKDANVARQSPQDHLDGLEQTVTDAIRLAREADPAFDPADIIGIGVDTTGSSPIPVDASNTALGTFPRFKGNLNAQCWLWKDHTSFREAASITELGRVHRPQFMAKVGNTYSSEWWWSKIWHCLRVNPAVFEAAHSWVELCDWVPSVLAGVKDPLAVRRGVCAAGHKALYSDEWGGLPDKEFLAMLDPKLAELRDRLYAKAYDASESAGNLSSEWAQRLGLREGIAIAIGAFDVHYGAIGSGVTDGVLVKAIGTSTCDCSVISASDKVPDISGICGIVKGSILPGYYGVEAGQSAVGDLFKWYVERVLEGEGSLHKQLRAEVEHQKPGESGLLALDWNNGNRTILVDQRLTGLILGQTLHTTRAELYRALVEATAFGARTILEHIVAHGVKVERIVCCGGIAEKDAMLMQIYADVTGCEMCVSRSAQTCALGAAISAAVLAGPKAGGHADFETAKALMTGVKDTIYKPNPEHHAVYSELFQLYKKLHDAFGGVAQPDLGSVMKELLDIKERQRGA